MSQLITDRRNLTTWDIGAQTISKITYVDIEFERINQLFKDLASTILGTGINTKDVYIVTNLTIGFFVQSIDKVITAGAKKIAVVRAIMTAKDPLNETKQIKETLIGKIKVHAETR